MKTALWCCTLFPFPEFLLRSILGRSRVHFGNPFRVAGKGHEGSASQLLQVLSGLQAKTSGLNYSVTSIYKMSSVFRVGTTPAPLCKRSGCHCWRSQANSYEPFAFMRTLALATCSSLVRLFQFLIVRSLNLQSTSEFCQQWLLLVLRSTFVPSSWNIEVQC